MPGQAPSPQKKEIYLSFHARLRKGEIKPGRFPSSLSFSVRLVIARLWRRHGVQMEVKADPEESLEEGKTLFLVSTRAIRIGASSGGIKI